MEPEAKPESNTLRIAASQTPEKMDNLHATFVRNVEHELRTPLTIMAGYAELLKTGELGELAPEQQQAMFVIVNRADELKKLVDRIGVLMSAESGAGVAIPLDLTEIIGQVTKRRADEAAQKGVTLLSQVDSDLPEVLGDPRLVSVALDCLVENACKFTPSGGEVEIRSFAEPGWACVSIRDTGVGIDQDKLAQLFSGFYQADGSTTRSYGGIGLGLTVARTVMDAHRGKIQAASQPGQGSCFTIRLPVQATLGLAGQAAPRPRRILVVDDETNVALSLQASLEKLPNCEVVAERNGDRALQLFEQQPFDLLVTDYKMPGMDGMTLATRIRQLYPQTAIMLITAYDDDHLREQAARAAVHRILDKPVQLAEIRSAALQALDQSAVK